MKRSLRRKLIQTERRRVLSAEERTREILDERTARLAARSSSEPTITTTRALVCGAGGEHFALSLEAVSEVLPFRECMPVPDAPPAMIGLFGRGGRLVSVIDLAVALGLAPASTDGEAWHLVVLRREQPQVALRVERAFAVSDIAPLADGERGAFLNEAVTGYATTHSGLSDEERVLSVLDPDRLLRPYLSSSSASGV